MTAQWIWLSQRQPSDRAKRVLMEAFGSVEAIYNADSKALTALGVKGKLKDRLLDKDLGPAEAVISLCAQKAIGILTPSDPAYPQRLQSIYNPPDVLYYRGTLPDFDRHAVIGMVGTRSASPYGMELARRFGYQVARCGGLVVTGLAMGIDTGAAQGALLAKAPVVGVLGCGVDVVYPQVNEALFQSVLEQGCLISEYPPETPPLGRHFPRRNRIISGLSCGVVVVEAPEKSGALITATEARDQGRDVFVVPGNVDLKSFVGSNRLLRDGAMAVGCGWDILGEYEAIFPDTLKAVDFQAVPQKTCQTAQARVAQPRQIPAKTPEKPKKINPGTIDNSPRENYSDPCISTPALTAEERLVLGTLSQGSRRLDEILRESDLSSGKALGALTMLEIKGCIKRLPGGAFCRKTD